MKIYIASSWSNQHGVEMLTAILRERKHEIASWIENCPLESARGFDFEKWIEGPQADRSFIFDTSAATSCDLFIYYGPAGSDAAAEMGAAFGRGIRILGLYAKGDKLGLMRKMISQWFDNSTDLINAIDQINSHKPKQNLYENHSVS